MRSNRAALGIAAARLVARSATPVEHGLDQLVVLQRPGAAAAPARSSTASANNAVRAEREGGAASRDSWQPMQASVWPGCT